VEAPSGVKTCHTENMEGLFPLLRGLALPKSESANHGNGFASLGFQLTYPLGNGKRQVAEPKVSGPKGNGPRCWGQLLWSGQKAKPNNGRWRVPES